MKVFLLTMVLLTSNGQYKNINVTPPVFPSKEKCEEAANEIVDALFADATFPNPGVVRYTCTPYEA